LSGRDPYSLCFDLPKCPAIAFEHCLSTGQLLPVWDHDVDVLRIKPDSEVHTLRQFCSYERRAADEDRFLYGSATLVG
jgi:hypothetical protein